ncbi:MAG: nucleotidyltransferase family protein [Clostridiales bacterium]|nr:nucleotidyltransferase family protein [Clostridiales bacterium]
MKSTGAVLVAAGMSSRMGDFKPMMPYGNSSISRHLAGMLLQLNLAPIVVVTGHKSEELEEHLSHEGIRFVKNARYKETQMFDSVVLGIKNIQDECERIMILPVDIPAIQLETIRQTLMLDAELIRTLYHGQPGHPIILSRKAATKLCSHQGIGGLRGAMENSGIPITNLEVEDPGVCWDVDTKEEYRKLLEWTGKREQMNI